MDLMNSLSFAAVAALLVMSPGPNGLLIAKTVPTSGKMAGFANVAGFVAAFHFHGALSILGISAIILASSNAFFAVKILGAAYLCWIGFKALRDFYSGSNEAQIVAPAERTRTGINTRLYSEQFKHSPLLMDLLNHAGTIRWPIHMVKKMDVYLKAERRLQKKMDKKPTAENIAALCEKPVADVKRMLELRDRILLSKVSLESDGDRPLLDLIPISNNSNPTSKLSAFFEGFLTNVLNPKTSMFYLAAFPQFIAIGDMAAASAYILVLLHTIINIAWFGTMVILFARLARFTNRESFQRWLKGITGVVFIGFGVRLALY